MSIPSTAPCAFTLGPSLLFCPGSMPARFGKAAARADAVIIDLEDAVTAVDKPTARIDVARALDAGAALTAGQIAGRSAGDAAGPREADRDEPALDPETTLVRLNAGDPEELEADLQALDGAGVRHLVVPKAADVAVLDRLHAAMPQAGLIPQIERPDGVLAASALAAHPAVEALFWGTEDMTAALGGTTSRTPDGALRGALQHIRHMVLITAAAHGLAAVDATSTELRSRPRLTADAEEAWASGFAAKACIHPDQVEPIRRAYMPAPADVERAKALLAAAPSSPAAFRFRGEMVDAPVVAQARRVLARYDAGREHHEDRGRRRHDADESE
ncbi:CoA ester lyase [Nesterenkonia sp. F]|uniref:HpcH/HpaI aldolase/citrate lyase family protein n=1 Tax=Nesterenkonia sp. F TaxID=795955 RepID=UPI000255C976|nr:CoA ester lyase [Nesterenkonia sp. F]